MSHVDDVLQYFRDKLGIPSMAQADAADEADRSAYLKSLPTRISDKDVYLPAVQMQPETRPPVPHDWYKAPHAMAMPVVPTEDLGDPYAREALMQKLIEAERGAGISDPSAHGEKFGMLATAHHPQPMTAQEAQDYIDFISPQGADDEMDMPTPAVAAMRRRR